MRTTECAYCDGEYGIDPAAGQRRPDNRASRERARGVHAMKGIIESFGASIPLFVVCSLLLVVMDDAGMDGWVFEAVVILTALLGVMAVIGIFILLVAVTGIALERAKGENNG